MNFFSNGGTNGCGCNNCCDLILLILLLNSCGGGCGMNGMNSCDIIWLILLLSCFCGGGCGCK